MQITRRNFLHNSSAALALVGLGGGLKNVFGQKDVGSGLFPIPVDVYSHPLFSMTAKQLRSFIGREFLVSSSDGETLGLILVEVNSLERLSNSTRGFYGECFSLVLEGQEKRLLTQDNYEIRADGLQPFSALVVPTDRLKKRYELIVNRLSY